MFTGIVAEAGVVEAIQMPPDHRPLPRSGRGRTTRQRVAPASSVGTDAIRLAVRCNLARKGLKVGESIAVNGCCLTAVQVRSRERLVQFDLLRETWRRTNLQFAKPGSLVNLERPLRADGRLDGHFVTGHIDGLGRITRWKQVGADRLLEISAPAEIMRYVVFKGSIALDGISLTVAAVKEKSFRVWIIPHTLEVTALHERKVGDAVNVETDILGKYVERFVGS